MMTLPRYARNDTKEQQIAQERGKYDLRELGDESLECPQCGAIGIYFTWNVILGQHAKCDECGNRWVP